MNILTDEEILAAMTPEAVEGDWYLPQTFARAIEAAVLEKLAALDVEPFAVVYETRGGWYQPVLKVNEDSAFAIYTEDQLLAAQQRTAEACAKLAANGVGTGIDHGCCLNTNWEDGQDAIAAAIRNGDWRNYK